MPTNITLKVKDEEGNVTKKQHEIEDINLLQFEQMMKVIKDIFVKIQEDESLQQTFKELFEAEDDDEEAQDSQFIKNLINSFETLAVHLPAQAIHLLAVLADIEPNTLQRQKMLDVLDIYDAVIEENDLERLWKRAKKSLATTKAKLAFVNFKRKATQKPAQA